MMDTSLENHSEVHQLFGSVQKDLFAMVGQLGIPTCFCCFSCADLQWEEVIESLLKQEGKTMNFEDLDWSERCGLLRRNPLTAA